MPRSSWSLAAVSLTAVLFATGCTLSVAAGDPRPNIDLPESQASLALELDPSVRDVFQVPARSGVVPTNVEAWRTTLDRGFKNGFRSAFRTDGGKELVLQIVEAELELAPTAVNEVGGAAAAEAQVRYKARLVDAQGNVLRRSTGTVASKRSTSQPGEITLIAESAVESMYEKIAEDLFNNRGTASDSVP
ncbi:LPS assembly lipoprotein LptE [Pyxidicoccus trucidator]|uniref:LPS assembly lipoprotein LptE n=1 Tax=Pyxidicoccus trucidator TaxID=2709662 RepID=UPI0013DB3456|nr:LPS assembly lipoprotein LptE [Pyxidicoccus trucidator]